MLASADVEKVPPCFECGAGAPRRRFLAPPMTIIACPPALAAARLEPRDRYDHAPLAAAMTAIACCLTTSRHRITRSRLEARAGDAMPTCGQATCDCCHRRRERRVVVAISRFKAGGGQSRWARDYCHWRGEKPPARRAGPTFKARRDLFHIGRCEHRPLRKTR